MTIDFNNMAQVYALRTLLRSEVKATDSRLTDSEKVELRGRIDVIVSAARQGTTRAQQAFADYQTTLTELRGNAFKVETLTQKTDALAAAGVNDGLRADLTRLRARVNYLSQHGGAGGVPYLATEQVRLINGYLDRAQGRLTQYDNAGGVFTQQEAAAVRAALDGVAETGDPAGGAAALIQQIRALALA